MDISLWISVVGWIATFALGILSAVIVARLNRKRKIIAWTLLSESDLFPRDASAELGVPVRVVVGDTEEDSLSSVRVRLGASGEEVVENVTVSITFNESSRLLHVHSLGDLGEFEKYVTIEKERHSSRINFGHINPNQRAIDFEFLLSDYEPSSVSVDLAAPGVDLQRVEASEWNLSNIFTRNFSLRLMGVGYEPTVSPLMEIADELHALRRQLGNMPSTSDARRGDREPLSEIEKTQRTDLVKHVVVSVADMDFKGVHHDDVPRPTVRFRIENYLVDDIEFVDPDRIECDVNNDDRAGTLNVQPLALLKGHEVKIGRLGPTSVWMNYQISDETRQHLILNDGRSQRWRYAPAWSFKVAKTGEVFQVRPIECRFEGTVAL